MNRFLLVLLFLFSYSASFVYSQVYWGANTTSLLTNEAVDIEVDVNGNQYVAGYFSGSTNFGTAVAAITSAGNSDVYVAKYNSTGSLIWVKNFGGTYSDKPFDLAIDLAGNVIVTGQYFGQATFGTVVLNSVSNSKDMFLMKLDNSGTVIWAISQGGTGSENAYGIATDSQNNIILTGQFEGSSTIAGTALTSTIDPTTNLPNFDLFISKYNSVGTALWVKTGQAKYEERGFAISCDAQNNIFFTGQFSDTMIFAGSTFNNSAYNVGFLSKLSPTGTLTWFNKLKAGGVLPYDLEVRPNGEVFVTGDFWGNLLYESSFGNTNITNPYSKKIFVLKTNNNGQTIWHKTLGSSSDLSARSISIDNTGNANVTGYFKCNWSQFHTNAGSTFNSVGYKDAYLFKLDNLGELTFVKQFGGKQNDEGQGVAILPNQTAVIAGSFTNNLFIPRSIPATYTTGSTNFELTPYFPTFLMLNGDNTPNSFVLNAVHANTPDYNFFNGIPIDSLIGEIYPIQDTVHFCTSTSLIYSPKTNPYIGPNYTYLWNTGSTYDTTIISSSGTFIVDIERQDGCSQGGDTIVGVVHLPPSMPLITDNLGIAINAPNYPGYVFCAPDSVTIEFSNLCTGCTISILNPSPIHTDTLPHLYNQTGTYLVSVNNGFCTSAAPMSVTLEEPEPFDSIQPYFSFPQDYDNNDTVILCNNQVLSIHLYDSLTNPTGILDSFNNQPIYYSSMLSPNSLFGYLGGFEYEASVSSPGWYTFDYHVILGYENSCGLDTMSFFATDSIYIQINSFEIHGNDFFCPGSSVFLSVDTSLVNFTWSGPSIDWTSPNNDSIQASYSGVYVFSGVLTDTVNGCTGNLSVPFVLTQLVPPTIVMNPTDGIVCPGDSVTLSLPNTYSSYEWINPDGFIISTSNSVQDADQGFYYCHVTDTSGCILTTVPAEIIEFQTPFIYVDPTNVICDDEYLFIYVNYSGNAQISWINPISGGNQDVIVTNLPGMYICEIQQCGYTFIDSLEIYDGSFSVSLTVDDSILCNNELATLTTNSGYNIYEWSDGSTGSSILTTSTSGNYFVTVTNQFDCVSYSDTISITNVPLSSPLDIADTTVCSGNNLLLNDGLGNSVNWYDNNLNLLTSNVNFNFVNLQTDTSIIAAYDNNGCPTLFDTIFITIVQDISTTTILGNFQSCLNELSVFTLSDSVDNLMWYLNGNPMSSFPTFSIPSSSIPQLISVSFSNVCSSDSTNQIFTAFPPTLLSLALDSLIACGNTPNTLNVSGVFDSISWTTNLGNYSGTSLNVNSTFGNGNIYVEGIDTNSCPTNVDSIWITTSTIDFSVTNTNFECFGDTILLNFITSQDSLLWSATNFSTFENSQYIIIDNSTIGLYIVNATDTLGCMEQDTIDLNIIPSAGIILPSDTIMCLNSLLNYTSSSGNSIYTWEELQPGESVPVIGNNWYVLIATNSIGCSISDSIYIETVDCANSLPNVFSPNGDGINDYYYIDEALLFPNNELIVVNRWGNVVYSEKGYRNTWNGNDLVDGVYFVVFVHDYNHPEQFKANTFVHLVR